MKKILPILAVVFSVFLYSTTNVSALCFNASSPASCNSGRILCPPPASGNLCCESIGECTVATTKYSCSNNSCVVDNTNGTYSDFNSCTQACNKAQNSGNSTSTTQSSNGIQCPDGKSINTAIGCVPIDNQNDLIGFFLRWGIGIGGGIAFLLILVAGFQIMTSRGDPNRLKAGQELMTSAIAGLLLLIFSVVILRIIGVDILKIPGLSA